MRRSRFVMIVALLTALIFCIETSAVSAASLSEVRKSIQSKQFHGQADQQQGS